MRRGTNVLAEDSSKEWNFPRVACFLEGTQLLLTQR